MATIKSHTDLEQSKKLAEILPLESADMCWQYQKDRWVGEPDYQEFPQFEHATDKRDIPCWSLAALLSVLQYTTLFQRADQRWGCTVWIDAAFPYEVLDKDDPIDACVAMIEKLHEEKML